jgi:hypothetical protein
MDWICRPGHSGAYEMLVTRLCMDNIFTVEHCCTFLARKHKTAAALPYRPLEPRTMIMFSSISANRIHEHNYILDDPKCMKLSKDVH